MAKLFLHPIAMAIFPNTTRKVVELAMAEETKKFQDDILKVNVVGGKGDQKGGTKIVGGGGRAGDIKTLDKHPKK